MPGPYGLIRFVMLSIVTALAAMMLLIQPTVAEVDMGLDWRRGDDVVSCKDPSGGSLCLCAIVAGYGSDDEVKLYDFIREGGNRCELRSQEEHSHEYGDCIIDLYTFFTASGECQEHAGGVSAGWRWSSGSSFPITTKCLQLGPTSVPRLPGY